MELNIPPKKVSSMKIHVAQRLARQLAGGSRMRLQPGCLALKKGHAPPDIYGYDFLRQREIQVTDTPENESQPYLDGPWPGSLRGRPST